MFIISGTAPNRNTRRFVFDCSTIALVIAEKLERQGFEVEILDQRGDAVIQYLPDLYRPFLGLHI